MSTLLSDIRKQSGWLVQAFKTDGFKLDYSIESLKQIDRFFELHAKNGQAVPDGRLSVNLGPVIFSIGSYVGETFIKNTNGARWIIDDNDPQGEVATSILFADGGTVWPMQKVMKRFMNGEEDSIYYYAKIVFSQLTKTAVTKKPWWKFWK
jgi:hypothetical protein